MKKGIALLGLLCLILCGCAPQKKPAQVVATTLPVYEFTAALCSNTDVSVSRLVTENVSCLHDYSLSVNQVQAIEGAQVIVLSGGGLEDFLADFISGKHSINSSDGIALLECHHDHDHGHSHTHEEDAHIWLSPIHAQKMAENIYAGLSAQYPQHQKIFAENLQALLHKIDTLQAYGTQQLSNLSSRELITFHDGFSYFAQAFDLTIVKAIEEESGSEASAAELIALITLAKEHGIKAVFTERNGSISAADTVCAEISATRYALDMAISGDSWFDAMYHNIDTIKEALG